MAKAVLVMEMPESCSKCPAYESGGYNGSESYDGACFIEKHCMNGHMVTKGRPDWCPLRDLPKKDTQCYFPDEGADGYANGWNACITMIEGKCDDE